MNSCNCVLFNLCNIFFFSFFFNLCGSQTHIPQIQKNTSKYELTNFTKIETLGKVLFGEILFS